MTVTLNPGPQVERRRLGTEALKRVLEVTRKLAAQCAVALQRVQMTEALLAGARLKQEIAVAREVQMSTLPREMPVLTGYEVYGSFRPADETGGDTFDFQRLGDDRLFVMVADATGHGIGPALSVTQMQAMLRLAVRLNAGLDEAHRHVNNQLASDLPPERFVTACFGVIDADAHVFEYYAPGQGPILHFEAATGKIQRFLPTGPPLGAFPLEKSKPPRQLRLQPGDIVGLISDGIFEWPDANDAEFGVERVEAILREHHALPVAALAEKVFEQAAAFAAGAGQADDVTIVLFKRADGGKPVASPDVLEFELQRDFAELERVVAGVKSFWEAHSLADGDRFAVDFAIEELFTNMVKYGKPGPTQIRLRLQREVGAVAVLLVDPDSEKFDPTVDRKVDVGAPIETRRPGGLGLHLIPKLVDAFSFEYVGRESRITFMKRTES